MMTVNIQPGSGALITGLAWMMVVSLSACAGSSQSPSSQSVTAGTISNSSTVSSQAVQVQSAQKHGHVSPLGLFKPLKLNELKPLLTDEKAAVPFKTDRAPWETLLKMDESCLSDLEQPNEALALSVYPIGQASDHTRHWVVEFPCMMAAYQGSYRYVLLRQVDSHWSYSPLVFMDAAQAKAGQVQWTELEELVGLPTIDEKKPVLTILSKSRGMGDCGSWTRYQLNVQTGQTTCLEARSQACSNNPDLDEEIIPSQWPLLFSAAHPQSTHNP